MEPQGIFQIHPRVYLKSQKEEKDESNVEKSGIISTEGSEQYESMPL